VRINVHTRLDDWDRRILHEDSHFYDTTLCDTVCQWHAAGRWFSPDTPFSSTNKIDTHDRNEILLTVALNTIALVIALTITIIFLNVNFLLFKLFSFYFLLNWYFVRMINFACSYSIPMVFNATVNNISFLSWVSILLVEENGVSGENHRPAACHWHTCIEYSSP
jgi:hypothetical protein